jgi:FdhD protein
MPRRAVCPTQAIITSELHASVAGYAYAELQGTPGMGQTSLAGEAALAISYNGISQAVMMVSPGELEDFVCGFSLGAGLIDSIDDIYDIQLSGAGAALRADIQISSRAFWALKQQRRQLAGNSGCGLCGVEALEQALPQLPVLPVSPLPPIAHLHELRQRIAAVQHQARSSGALHAALFVDGDGAIRLCREDIGRHNALDKLIGALKREGLDCGAGFAVVTSRCSLELLHKAVRAGIGSLVSLSAPTALTVDWARRQQLNLIHLPHHSAPRVYSPAPAIEESRP